MVQKSYLGIIDFMLINGHVAWNMSAKLKGVFRTMIDNSIWRMFVAELMLNWKDPMVECETTTMLTHVVNDNHCPKQVIKLANVYIWCFVCGLETSIQKRIGIQIVDICDQSSNHMATCTNPNCNIIAQSHVSPTSRLLVLKIPHFVWLSFFEIARHELSTGLFSSTSKNSCAVDVQSCSKSSH